MVSWFLIYAALFLLIGVLFVIPIGSMRLRSFTWWFFVFWGAVSLELTLIIQPLIQKWWVQMMVSRVAEGIPKYLLLLFPLALISGLVQELLKGLPFITKKQIWLQKILNSDMDWRDYALAVGLGFGVWEAFKLVAWPVSYLSSFISLPVIERVMVIMFHVASTALFAYGIKKRKGVLFYFIASLAHGLLNYPVFLANANVVHKRNIYIFGFIIAGIYWTTTYFLWKRSNSNGLKQLQ